MGNGGKSKDGSWIPVTCGDSHNIGGGPREETRDIGVGIVDKEIKAKVGGSK